MTDGTRWTPVAVQPRATTGGGAHSGWFRFDEIFFRLARWQQITARSLFLLGDGSARFISESVDLKTFAALLSYKGGEIVGEY